MASQPISDPQKPRAFAQETSCLWLLYPSSFKDVPIKKVPN
jgi:hypothetical protein